MEKLTLDEFKKMYLDLENAYDKLYEKVKNGTAQEEIEKEDEVLSLEFYKKITSYDLSDIPASLLRFSLSIPVDIIDFSKTHANIDFDVTFLDEDCKYNFKGCNITNLEKVGYSVLINNKDSFDEDIINKYPYLFEELNELEIGNIKIKYLNTDEGLEKAQELYNFLQDKYFLFNNIKEIKLVNESKTEGETIFLSVFYNVLESFKSHAYGREELYRSVVNAIKYYSPDNMIDIKADVLTDINDYFVNNKYHLSKAICALLYYYKDTELLNEYINNQNIDAVIEKYFKTLIVEFMNYYFDNINDEFLNTNIDSFSEYFWVYLTINSKKQFEATKETKEDSDSIDINSLKDDEVIDYLKILLNLDKPKKSDEDTISNERILEITKEILLEIDNSGELVNIFNFALDNNKINLNGDDNYYRPFSNIVSIKNENNYSTVHTIIHEFFHYFSHLNSKGNYKRKPYLQEIASIFFESYAINYMIEKYGIDESKINFTRERDTVNQMNNISVEKELELFKVKNERNLVYEDIIKIDLKSSDELSLELLKKLYGNKIKEKNFFNRIAFNLCNPYIQRYRTQSNELLSDDSKVLISYTLGTELAKKHSRNPECVELFLNLSRCVDSADFDEAELFKELLESINKENTKH